jgi:hypothetical protein
MQISSSHNFLLLLGRSRCTKCFVYRNVDPWDLGGQFSWAYSEGSGPIHCGGLPHVQGFMVSE